MWSGIRYGVLGATRTLSSARSQLLHKPWGRTAIRWPSISSAESVNVRRRSGMAVILCPENSELTQPGVVQYPEKEGPESFSIQKLPDLSRESLKSLGEVPSFSKVYTGERNIGMLQESGDMHVIGLAPCLGLGPNVPVATLPHHLQLQVNTLADVLNIPDEIDSSEDSTQKDRPPDYLSQLESKSNEIATAHFGLAHTCIVAQNGSLWTTGEGREGQLGTTLPTNDNEETGSNGDLSWWPAKVTTFDEQQQSVVDTSASRYFSLALTESGRVYSFGAGFQGELGLGETPIALTPTPVYGVGRDSDQFQSLERTIQVRAGMSFSVALTEEGNVYWWGRIGGKYPGGQPNRLEKSTGEWSTAKESQRLEEEYNLLENYIDTTQSKVPIKLEFVDTEKKSPRITQIACGAHFILATDGDSVWSVGLTPGTSGSKVSLQPSKIEKKWGEEEAVQRIAAGGHNGAVVTDKGRVFAFGDSLEFCLTESGETPKPIGSLTEENLVVHDIAIEDTHACVLVNSR